MGRFTKTGRWSEPNLKTVCQARIHKTEDDASEMSGDDADELLSYCSQFW